MSTWINDDGLTVKFGPDKAVPARVTEYSTGGTERTTEVLLDADYLSEDGVALVLDSYRYYEGSVLTGYKLLPPDEAFVGGTEIEVSLVDTDGTSNPVVVVTPTLAELNGQDADTLNIGPLTAPKVIRLTPSGTFTEGAVQLVLYWSVLKNEDDTLVWDKSA